MAVYAVLLVLFTIFNRELLIVGVDTRDYMAISKNLISNGTYTDRFGVPDTWRSPGYPFFITLLLLICDSLYFVVAVQMVLSILCVYLIYKICLMLNVKKGCALLCCIVYILDLSLYIYTSFVLSDALFLYCLVITTFFLLKYLKSKKCIYFILFIAMLNFALAVRPILIYYNMLICLLMFVLLIMKKVQLRHLIISVIFFAIIFGGWSARNYMHKGVFVYSDVRNINLFKYDAVSLRKKVENISSEEAKALMEKDFSKKYPKEILSKMSESQIIEKKAEVSREYIGNHFGQYLMLNVRGLFRTMLGPNNSFISESISNDLLANIVKFGYVGYLLAVYLFYVISWLINFKKAGTIDCFLLTVSGYCAVASASVGYARFRVAFFGLLVLGAFVLWKDLDMIQASKQTINTVLKKVHK